jgi:hypothetical protein
MSLYPTALTAIRTNLELAANKQKPPIIRIGVLSAAQLVTVNAQREEEEMPPVVAEVLFDGRHLYNSRCVEDGYSIDEVLEMISIAFSDASDVAPGWLLCLSVLRRESTKTAEQYVTKPSSSATAKSLIPSSCPLFREAMARITAKRRRPPVRVAFSRT